MKQGIFVRKIREDLLQKGGSTSIGEFRRMMGTKYRIKREEMPDLLQELRRSRHFKISNRRVKLL